MGKRKAKRPERASGKPPPVPAPVRKPRGPSRKQRKKLFLAMLEDGATVGKAAKEGAGVSRAALYQWRDQDEAFRLAWDKAMELGYGVEGDWYEDRLKTLSTLPDRAGVEATKIGLKMKKRFVERQELSGEGGGPVALRVEYAEEKP